MKRLIHVRLRHGNIVLEPSGYRLPHGVDDTQHSIALFDGVDDYPYSNKVKDLVKLFVLELHFFVNAVIMFGSSVYVILQIHVIEGFFYLMDDNLDGFLPLSHLFVYFFL